MRTPLRVAAAQPRCTAFDVGANARAHAAVIHNAQARVVVFPELSMTGYELDAEPVPLNASAWQPIVEACEAAGSLALVGAPIEDEAGCVFIAMLRVDGQGVQVAYRKTWLGSAETPRFCPGDGPTVLEVDGWRLGLGICKDTGVLQHVAAMAELRIDAYLAGLVHRPEELPQQEARADVLARACRAWVVFASFAGPTGDVFDETAGSSAIWSPAGVNVVRAGAEPGAVISATLG